jgi:serine protease inhibitor
MIGYHRALPAALAALATRTASANVEPSNQQSFADELTSNLYTKANECSSALGVSMAFSLVYPGCTDDGITEIQDVMGYPDDTNMQLVWENQTQRMLAASPGGCLGGSFCDADAPLLQIANSVWFDDGDTLNQDYEAVVGEYAKQIDFEAADSPVIVNEWVSDSTNGLIDSIVDESKPLFPPYVLIAINSIYLKASWAEQFPKYKTNLDSFYATSAKDVNEASDAHFMNNVDYFSYSHDALPGYQVIDLPFASSTMSMIFVLPNYVATNGEGDTVAHVFDAVTSRDLIAALENLSSTRVALSVPKFKFESKYDDGLKDALMSTGITAPFTEGSRALCGIFENAANCEKLIIDKVVQKTIIDVNEEGVEAAAVTMVGVSLTSIGPVITDDPVLMVLDHPFQFFIYDKTEDLVLFEGRLGAPELPEGMPEMALTEGKHSDNDFWLNEFGVETVVDPPAVALVVTDTSSTTTTKATESSTTGATLASGSSTSDPTSVASSSTTTTQPGGGSDATASDPTSLADSTTTTQPGGGSDVTTTKATAAPDPPTSSPTMASDPTSVGNVVTGSSMLASIVLASALVLSW